VREGLFAYSCKQAAILDGMAKQFANEWYPFLAAHGCVMEWPTEYVGGIQEAMMGAMEEEVAEDDDSEIDDDMFD
jgi:hypothetical protein